MECPYCKAENRDGVRYCGSCGKLIGQSNTTESTVSPASPVSRSLTPGFRLQGGRYVIKKVLGQGGMGAALLAIDLRLDSKRVVIKELISDTTDPQQRQDDVRNFKREVATLAHIDHPLVPAVTDHFQEGTRYFMVQEYAEGENLEEHLERTQRPMSEREALICASEVLDILDYLAQQTPPLVHRDIKPANIIIGAKDRRAHLVDFGIARAEAARNAQRKQTSALGTPGYAPPEQYQGNADPRSDLYALGATLHHILTNRDPRGYTPFAYPPVRSLNAALSPEIERVLERALTNDINQRYQSAATMKLDIDEILRHRFGVSGNINSYTLGSSGPIGTITAASTMQAGAAQANIPPTAPAAVSMGSVPTTPPYHGMPPVSPPPHYQPMGGQGQQRPAPKRRKNVGLATLLIALILLVTIGGVIGVFSLRNASTQANESIGAARIGDENIGLSDGTIIFDGNRGNGDLKNQAATKLKQSKDNPTAAMPLFREAIAQETNDAESLIYLEDQRVLASGSPYVTIVVATMLSGDDALVSVGRESLQGAYVAQKEYNDGAKLPGGMQVRLLIANTGSKTDYVAQVVQRIRQLAQSDKTFVGVMGMPFSSRSLAAVSALRDAQIPMVSPTSSSNELTNISPYFFRVAPANRVQAVVGVQYSQQVLKAKKAVVFVDPSDTYSQSLASDFSQLFQSNGSQVVATEKYTIRNPASISARVQDALNNNPDLIYFSGYAQDVSTLLVNLPPGSLPVLGGDALYELGGYQGSARANFSRLHFTAFAYPDQWDVLGYGSKKPAFFTNYATAFDPDRRHTGSPYGFTRPANDVILSYDATVALLVGCDNVLRTGKKTVTPVDLQQGLKQITGARGFQGVSGQIAFGPDNDPVAKAIVILSVDSEGHIRMEPRIPDGTRFLK